jgi:hypothetical protein
MRELFLKLRGIMELLLSGFAAIQLVMLSAGCELWVSAVATFASSFAQLNRQLLKAHKAFCVACLYPYKTPRLISDQEYTLYEARGTNK